MNWTIIAMTSFAVYIMYVIVDLIISKENFSEHKWTCHGITLAAFAALALLLFAEEAHGKAVINKTYLLSFFFFVVVSIRFSTYEGVQKIEWLFDAFFTVLDRNQKKRI